MNKKTIKCYEFNKVLVFIFLSVLMFSGCTRYYRTSTVRNFSDESIEKIEKVRNLTLKLSNQCLSLVETANKESINTDIEPYKELKELSKRFKKFPPEMEKGIREIKIFRDKIFIITENAEKKITSDMPGFDKISKLQDEMKPTLVRLNVLSDDLQNAYKNTKELFDKYSIHNINDEKSLIKQEINMNVEAIDKSLKKFKEQIDESRKKDEEAKKKGKVLIRIGMSLDEAEKKYEKAKMLFDSIVKVSDEYEELRKKLLIKYPDGLWIAPGLNENEGKDLQAKRKEIYKLIDEYNDFIDKNKDK